MRRPAIEATPCGRAGVEGGAYAVVPAPAFQRRRGGPAAPARRRLIAIQPRLRSSFPSTRAPPAPRRRGLSASPPTGCGDRAVSYISFMSIVLAPARDHRLSAGAGRDDLSRHSRLHLRGEYGATDHDRGGPNAWRRPRPARWSSRLSGAPPGRAANIGTAKRRHAREDRGAAGERERRSCGSAARAARPAAASLGAGEGEVVVDLVNAARRRGRKAAAPAHDARRTDLARRRSDANALIWVVDERGETLAVPSAIEDKGVGAGADQAFAGSRRC